MQLAPLSVLSLVTLNNAYERKKKEHTYGTARAPAY